MEGRSALDAAFAQQRGARQYEATGIGMLAFGIPEGAGGAVLGGTTGLVIPLNAVTNRPAGGYRSILGQMYEFGQMNTMMAPLGTFGEAAAIARLRGAAAESAAPSLVQRLGPKGVDPLHHNANVLVRDSSGNVVAHQRFVSGNMTLEEQALGFPRNTLASHTEARAVRTMELEPGGRMVITGQNPPCPSCKGAMNRTANETGGTIRYQWRQDGKTLIWTAKPKGQ